MLPPGVDWLSRPDCDEPPTFPVPELPPPALPPPPCAIASPAIATVATAAKTAFRTSMATSSAVEQALRDLAADRRPTVPRSPGLSATGAPWAAIGGEFLGVMYTTFLSLLKQRKGEGDLIEGLFLQLNCLSDELGALLAWGGFGPLCFEGLAGLGGEQSSELEPEVVGLAVEG